MNQVIGIEFQAKNHSQVIKAIRSMARTVGALVSQIQTMNSGLAKIAVSAFPSTLQPQIAAVKEMTAAVAGLNAQTKAFRGIKGPIVAPVGGRSLKDSGVSRKIAAADGGPQSTHRQDSSGLPWMLGAVPYALRWGVTGGAIYGGMSLGKETLLGGSRKDVAPLRRDISVLGFDKKELDNIEAWADEFTKKYWVGGDKAKILSGFTEMASAFDPKDSPYFRNMEHGRKTLTRMTEAGVVLGAAAKMNAEAGNELLSSAIQAQLAFMKPQEVQAYKDGTKDIGDLAEQTAAKIGGAIKVTAVWGKEIQQAFSYALPGALQMGWDIDTLLAYTGMMKTAGIPGSRAGRAQRMFLEKGPEDMAYLMFAGSSNEQKAAAFKALPEKDRKKYAEAYAPLAKQLYSQDPFGFGRELGKMLERAEGRGFQLGKILDTDFTQIFRAFTQPEMVQRMQDVYKSIMNYSFPEMKTSTVQDAEDAGWFIDRMSNAWKSMKDTLGRLAGKTDTMQGLVEAMVQPLYTIRDWASGHVGGEKIIGDVIDLVMKTSWALVQTVSAPAKWFFNAFGTDLQWVSYSELQQAVEFLINDVKDLLSWIAKPVMGAVEWLRGFMKNIGSVMPISPYKSEWQFPKHEAPEAIKRAVSPQAPSSITQGSSSKQPLTIQIAPQTDTIKIDTTLNIGAEQLARLQAEAERLRNSKNGVSFGNDLNQGVIMP